MHQSLSLKQVKQVNFAWTNWIDTIEPATMNSFVSILTYFVSITQKKWTEAEYKP